MMFPVVLITWLDAQGMGDTWLELSTVKAFCESRAMIQSVGIQIYKDKDVIVLTSAIGDHCGTLEQIPLSMIQDIKILAEVEANSIFMDSMRELDMIKEEYFG